VGSTPCPKDNLQEFRTILVSNGETADIQHHPSSRDVGVRAYRRADG